MSTTAGHPASTTRDAIDLTKGTRRPEPVLAHVTTVPVTLNFFRGQVADLKAEGFEIHAISSPGPLLDEFGRLGQTSVHAVRMHRKITPLRDVVSVVRLCRALRRIRPDIVHGHTPKAGLLAMLAATATGVPVRVYTLHGLPFLTCGGLRRLLLMGSDWVACRLAHQVYSVSRSVRDVAVTYRLCAEEHIKVLRDGTACGIDAFGRFDPATIGEELPEAVRRRHGIPSAAPLIGFVGRIAREKGVAELIAAWSVLREEFPTLRLVVVGAIESHNPPPEVVAETLRNDPRVHHVSQVAETAPYYAAMDVLVLPTYREGFSTVAMEAASMSRPVVATRVPGCVDAVEDGLTGALVAAHDPSAIADAVRTYLRDPALRREHGRQGRERVVNGFRQDQLSTAISQEYTRLLGASRGGCHILSRWLKRTFDLAVAVSALLIFWPLLLAISVVVYLAIGRPVLFHQPRVGFRGARFTIWKFRTMAESRGPDGCPLPDEARLTRLGRFLRRTSLDELPQLWNVVRGDLSLVGPRPLLPEYLPLYTLEQSRRHQVMPGITGWAQIHGRNATEWEDRLARDIWYVDHRSLALDLKILAMTARKVLTGEGVSGEGVATMPRFQGIRKADA